MKKIIGKLFDVQKKAADYINSKLVCDDLQKWVIETAVKDLISNMKWNNTNKYHACNHGIQFDITFQEVEINNKSKYIITVDNICTGRTEVHNKITGAILEAGSPDIIGKYNPDNISIFYEKIDKWDLDFIPYAV